ncbi:MAG: 4-hydroxy-tetrahydrodipicolinate reductase [Candidatus Micrarchaeia archaeon]
MAGGEKILRVCILGATGRMGSAVAAEINSNYKGRVEIVAGVTAEPFEKGAKVAGTNAPLYPPSELSKAIADADCTISFTTPEAEASNVPVIAAAGKNIVIGTTGMNEAQLSTVRKAIERSKGCAVIASNFSPLVNTQIYLAKRAAEILGPLGYDFGIIEEHHTGKKDAPSGTAKTMANMVIGAKACDKVIYRKEEMRVKEKGELDMCVLRLGGTPGQHELRVVGKHGRLIIESLMYSRSEFASGAIQSALWLAKNGKPGRIYGIAEILGIG